MSQRVLLSGLLILICCFSCAVLAFEPALRPGVYDSDELIVARDSATQQVTGYYRSYTGAGQFSCIFYFEGKLEGSRATIASYFPEDPNGKVEGTLAIAGGNELRIVLKQEHGGCWNVRHFADPHDPAVFTLSEPHDDWQAIKIVKSVRAYFYQSPEETTRRKSYIVKGDAVGVKESKDAWLDVDFLNSKGATSGWMRSADFF